jgi:bacteriocin leader peptide (microcyclamide/patellamide family)
MDKQNLMPQAAQPVNRITTGQLPTELAELSEEALQLQGDHVFNSASVLLSSRSGGSSSTCTTPQGSGTSTPQGR